MRPSRTGIHGLFEAHAARAPQAVALVFDGREIAYGELDRRANRLAGRLRGLGVAPGALVGVCMERSVELVVALLGVLKAGAAYVPLDPTYPRERLAFMRKDAGVELVLTQSHLRGPLEAMGALTLCLDAGWSAGELDRNIEVASLDLGPESLAHVIYTSGSTGRPKGVCVPHRAVVARLAGGGGFVEIGCGDRGLLASSISFDAATLEIWGPLLNGAQLYVLPPRPPSLKELGQAISRHDITLLWLSAGLFNLMVEEQLGALRGVKQLIAGGEALSLPHVKKALAALPATRLINGYGPTENTIFTCSYPVLDAAALGGSVPIGKPLRGTRVYLLDEHLREVKDGEIGELYSGGDGLTLGYWERPELTAERFVRDPFASEPGTLMYRTGDLARRLPGGDLEYLGRADDQVKIRGYRLELGEIETVLAEHPAVGHAVAAVKDGPSGKQLAVYWVRRRGASATHEALRHHLRERLPEHMLPARLIEIETLPLTSNGKVDRRALLTLEPLAANVNSAAEAPRTPAQELIAGVFAEVLSRPFVGSSDDFFAMGGDSLGAAAAMSRLGRFMGVDLPVSLLFEAPSAAALERRIASSGQRRAAALPLEPLGASAEGPLSSAQQRLFFLERLSPGGASHNVAVRFLIRGPLDRRALRRSLQEIVRRHDALRTTFSEVDGEPRRLVLPAMEAAVRTVDLRTLLVATREERLRRIAAEDASEPFDLARGPLFRLKLAVLGEEEHALLLVVHHLVCDAASIALLADELAALYPAFCADRPSPLPDPAHKYGDQVAWQSRFLEGPGREEQLAYWTGALKGAPPYLDLPVDRPLRREEGRSELFRFELDSELSSALLGLSRRQGVTRFMTLFAAFNVLLLRHTGAEDICIGTPISSRRRPEAERLFGLFINTLALRTDLSEDPPFVELLRRVRKATLEAYDNQDMPLEQVLSALSLPREPGRAPFVQVMFGWQNALCRRRRLGDASIDAIEIDALGTRLDLGVEMEEAGDILRGIVQYDAGLFDASTIARIAARFVALLRAIVKRPEARLSALELLPDEERAQVIAGWNRTKVDVPRMAVSTLLREQAERTPEAVALAAGDRSLTYRQLDRSAERFARRLRSIGVGPEVKVAIAARSSMERVIAILGVWKAGGAYLPLDRSYPEERLAFILGDAAPQVLIAEGDFSADWPAERPRIGLDEIDLSAPLVESAPVTEPIDGGASADNLAYIIYTSGSTGRPKGVLVEHRGLSSLASAQAAAFGLRPGSRVLQFAAFGFDASVWELVMALTSGATLCLPRPGSVLLADELAAVLRDERIEIVTLPPSALATLPDEATASLRTVVVAGEACPGDLVRRFAHRLRLFNAYGPTETTICATMHECSAGTAAPPIGRPIHDSRVFVLDARQTPAPIGVPGELYIGGAGVARGYLNRAELTAERFIADPFSGEAAARLYRTGDLVKWLPDGTLSFLGRLDHQIKIRGYRIELGEIESVLAEHPGVREAAAMAREDGPAGKRIVACWVPCGAPPDDRALLSHLRQKLPPYMIPAELVRLDALPLSANGKVDRRALALLPAHRAGGGDSPAAPRTAVEKALLRIWADVLGAPPTSVGADFFSLGGHSLLATRVVAEIGRTLGVSLSLRALFEAPTVAALAERIETARLKDEPGLVPDPRSRAADAEMPLSFAEQRLWFMDELCSGSAAYNIPARIRIAGPLAVRALEHSLQALVLRHEALRTTFPQTEGIARRQVAASAALSVGLVDLEAMDPAARAAEVARIVAREASQPFDLAVGPLVRAKLLRLSPGEHLLLWTVHHIVADGWSIDILIRELAALYAAHRADRPASLPPLSLQYGDFAAWQRRLPEARYLAQLEFWKRRLAGAPPFLDLPLDRPRPAVTDQRGAVVEMALPAALIERVDALARGAAASRFMTLLAAFFVLLGRHSGASDLCVGTPVSGRDQPELEALMGLFVNTLVLRADLADNPTFVELLGQVRDTALSAFEHKEVPFERVVEALNPPRELGRSPLFSVMFALQNAPADAVSAADVELSLDGFETVTAKFDLTLSFGAKRDGGLRGWLEYSTEIFERATIERMAERFRSLLEDASRCPEKRILDLEMLAEAERARLLVEWNESGAAGEPACLHELFAAQAQRTPHAVALVCDGERLSYKDLHARAERLAQRLRALGAGRGTLVALHARRSLTMVTAMLGVLLAGAAYVPLDPAYPAERLAFMLEDSGARVLLGERAIAANLPRHNASVLYLDSDEGGALLESAGAAAPLREGNAITAARPDDPAYVIYTSGSTGRPKGVVIEHRNAAAFACWARSAFTPEELAAVLASTSICFDLSIFEILVPLCWGGRAVLVENALAIFDLPANEPITLINTVPSVMAGLLSLGPLPASVRTVNLAGEPLSRALAERVHKSGGAVRLCNLYGPTETTTYSTAAEVPRGARPSIGRPIAGTRVYVLDNARRPAPIGVPGELWIGGAGVARGYLHRPELTAERFAPDPFAGAPQARMYRTGDRARWLATGELEYLGRMDNQLKIRGFRIEPEEIEAVLAEHPGVGECAVTLREVDPCGKQLVAYFVPAAGGAPQPEILKEHLARKLPEHMVPSVLVQLSALARLPNGKVDRAALPAPAANLQAAPRQAPGSAAEELLCDVFAEVLRIARPGVGESFFSLGGDSIHAIQVVARARKGGLGLSVRQLFQHPTVRALAAAAAPLSDAEPARQGAVSGPVALTPIQHWFFEQEGAEPHHFNQAMLLETPDLIERRLLGEAIRSLLLHHDALRHRFVRGAEQWQQTATLPGDALPLEVIARPGPEALSLESALEKARLAHATLCLESGPLLRFILIEPAQGEPSYLLITAHHLVIDGVSWHILLDDLACLYERLSRGEAAMLPAKTTSFQRWAEALAACAESPETLAELPFWQRMSAPSRLPFDRPARQSTVSSSRAVRVALDPESTRALVNDVPDVYRTQIHEVLLSALAIVLSQWMNAPAVRLDLEGHGREEIAEGVEVSRTIGWFTTLFPVTLALPPGAPADLRALLMSVKEQLLCIPRRGIGHGLLRYLRKDPAVRQCLAELPAADVVFNYLGHFAPAPPGSRWRRSALESGPLRAASYKRRHAIEINGWIADGRLHMEWTYSEELHERATIEAQAGRFFEALRAILGHCREAGAGGRTPADFPLARIGQEALDRLTGSGRGVEDLYPMTPMQQGMLFQSLRDPGAGHYIEQLTFRISQDLDVAALRAAWAELAMRHAALRTAFLWEEVAEPLQVVRRDVLLPFTEIDLENMPEAEQEARFEALIGAERGRGFALAEAPLLRVVLARLGQRNYRLLLTHHHLLLDGWSLSLLLEELCALYEAKAQGVALTLPAPRPFRDYVAWLGKKERQAALSHFRDVLDGCRPPAPSPFARRHPAPPASSAARGAYPAEELALSERVTAALVAFARQHAVTLSTVVEGAFAMVLAGPRESDVVYGTTVSGRSGGLAGMESMVGLLIHTVPARARLAADTDAVTWLRGLAAAASERLAYEHAPLAEVQRACRVRYESLFVFENYPAGNALQGRGAGLVLEQPRCLSRTEAPLVVAVSPGKRLLLRACYSEERFEAESVSRMLQCMASLLEALAAHPGRRLGELMSASFKGVPEFAHCPAAPEEGSPPSASLPAAGPRDDLERALVEIWEKLLGRSPISVQDDFSDLGGHSLLAVALLSRIKERFGKSLPLSTLLEAPTVAALAAKLRERATAQPASPLWAFREKGQRPPLFVVHPAGGSVLCLRELARALGDEQPFYGLRARGLEQDGEPQESVEEMASVYLEAVRGVQPQGPYLLGGFSFGGLVALEMARALAARGQRVALLALLDTHPWTAGLDEEKALLAMARAALPEELSAADRSRWQRALEAHVRAMKRHVPSRYPGRITLLRAAEQPAMPAVTAGGRPAELDWSRISPMSPVLRTVPGDHRSMLREPHVRVLAAELRSCIAAADIAK